MRVVVIATKKTPSNRESRASHAREQTSGSSETAAAGPAWVEGMAGFYVVPRRLARRNRTPNNTHAIRRDSKSEGGEARHARGGTMKRSSLDESADPSTRYARSG